MGKKRGAGAQKATSERVDAALDASGLYRSLTRHLGAIVAAVIAAGLLQFVLVPTGYAAPVSLVPDEALPTHLLRELHDASARGANRRPRVGCTSYQSRGDL